MTNLKKFLIFSQKSFFNFQKTELSYILGKVCSNPWHIQNPVKHLRWNDLQKKKSYLAHFLSQARKIKEILRKSVSYISGNGNFVNFKKRKP